MEKAKTFLKKTDKLLSDFGLPDMLLLRFASVYLFAFAESICTLRNQKILAIANWKEFIENLNIINIALLIVFGFVFLTAIYRLLPEKFKISDSVSAVISTICFSSSLLWLQNNFYLSLGVCAFSLVIIGYALNKADLHKVFDNVHHSVFATLLAVLTVVVTVFISVCTIYRHKIFSSTTHDFGLFVQMFHSLAKDLTAVTSMERDTFISHFEIHSSFIYYLLVPFFKLFPREETLLIAQAILAMGGIIPLYLIAKRREFKGLSLFFICFIYTFGTCLIAPCFFDFHENAFLPTLLMWLLWAVDAKKVVPFYIFSVLTCLVKEDAPLFVICIGLYWFFEYKKLSRIHGIITAFLSAEYMLLMTSWLTNNGDGKMMTSSRFGHLLINADGGLIEVVKNSLLNPGYLLSMLVNEETFRFFIQVLLPLLFLPLFTKKIHRLLLIIPFIITNLVIGTGYGYASNIGYQYIFGPGTLLIFMTLINVSDFAPQTRKNLSVLLGSAALLMSIGTTSHQVNKIGYYHSNEAYFQSLEETLDSLPKDAVIGGDPFLIPHIADYKEVYIFDKNDINQEENVLTEPYRHDFIVIPEDSETRSVGETAILDAGYVKLETEVSEKIAIYQSPRYQEQ